MKKSLTRLALTLWGLICAAPAALADEIYEPPAEAVESASAAPYVIAAAAAVCAVIVLAAVIRRRRRKK